MRDASETIVKSAGDIFLAPVDTAAPDFADLADDSVLEGDGWDITGWLHEDGPTLAGFQGDNTKLYAWNTTAPARSITRVTEPQVDVPFIQFNPDTLSLYFPGAQFDTIANVLTIPQAGNPVEYAVLIRVVDGDRVVGWWFPRTSPRGDGDLEFPGDDFGAIPVSFDVLASETIDELGQVIGAEKPVTS
jgi:hypothetical protein